MASDVSLSHGLPETILDPEPAHLLTELERASSRDQVAQVVASAPRSLAAWATLGSSGRDVMERYSAYRVGYHRGLDTLRQSGWRGSGYVRWEHPTNRNFLRCLDGLRACAEAIGEIDEAERCALFLLQLDPSWARTAHD